MEVKLSLKLESLAFRDGERIPDKYTCNGENVSPELKWAQGDSSVKSWALMLDDPDAAAGVFTHWVIYNIPPNVTSLPEKVPASEKIANGALQGKNSSKGIGYTGPCPPPGPLHHYYFSLYALDRMLDLSWGASKKQLQNAMKGHIVAQAKMTAVYQAT